MVKQLARNMPDNEEMVIAYFFLILYKRTRCQL